MLPETTEQPIKINPTDEPRRDKQLDVVRATQVARDYLRSIIGNLSSHEFKLEQIRMNGAENKYIVICSIIPDIGKDKDFYLIKVNVDTNKILPPIGKGKLNEGNLELTEISIDSKWEE